jgi:hypothetical protein
MLLDYHEIDPSATASQQEKWLKQRAEEIDLYGMTREEFDALSEEEYSEYIAGMFEMDL